MNRTNHEAFIKRYVSFILAAFMLIYTSSAYMPVNGEEQIYSQILRLHVIANSDSTCDQSTKLLVRDAILYELEAIYRENGTCSLDGAKAAIRDNMDRLTQAANLVLAGAPGSHRAILSLGKEHYPTKSYESVTLPAGIYNSLIVRIGNAQGKNWWCVLFPTLCLAQAQDSTESKSYVYEEDGEKFIAAGFTPEQVKLICESDSDEIRVKFRILEIFGSLFERED